MSAMIAMDQVRLTLGETRFGFDFTLPGGSFTAVTGPSGAGKSTMLMLLAGFEEPDSGTVVMQGKDMAGLHPGQRPLSFVFQDNNLFAHLDVFTNIALGISPSLRLSAVETSAVSKALDRVGLAGFEKRQPANLSGGERQRVAFARALVRKRPILLLDEPFAALDPELHLDMVTLLKDIHRSEGNTIVIVTHHQVDVERLADRVLSIDHGQSIALQQIGTQQPGLL